MSGRILVVDDILANRRLLQAKLEARYFEVILASNGHEALKAAVEQSPDVILLDVMMPGMDGYEVCRRLKADPKTAFIPVVMVTALSQQESRLQGLKAGADDFITKPFDDFGLLTRIGALLRYHSVASELRQREASGAPQVFDLDLDAEAMDRPSRVVVVDESVHRARRISDYLRRAGHVTASLQDAGREAEGRGIDVLILALDQQGFDPLRLCAQFKMGERTRAVAILLICDELTQDKALKALELGASDIIMSPVDREELLARVLTQTRRTRYIEILRRRVDRGIELSIIDPLTGLYNRRYMMNQLTQLLGRSTVDAGPVSVAAFDIDHFKLVNDTHGHGVGDDILRQFAARLRDNVRPMDIVCRQGGEEFLIIMPGITGDLGCMAAERIRCAVAARAFDMGEGVPPLAVTVSAGVATNEDQQSDSPQGLLRTADEALYAAKRSGRNRVMSRAA